MRMRGLEGPDPSPPKYDPKSSVKDGYQFICSTCFERHGAAVFGQRTLDTKECEACVQKNQVIDNRNFSKIADIQYLKTKSNRPYDNRKSIITKTQDGRRIYQNVEHLL